jgi:hypothetical protein
MRKVHPHKGEFTMSDWIDEEVNRLGEGIEEQKRTAVRDHEISQQGYRFWESLRFEITQAVEKINKTPEIRKRLGDGLGLEDANVGYIKVIKSVYPAVYLSVEMHQKNLGVTRKIVTGPEPRKVKRETESLPFELTASGEVFVRTNEGQSMGVHETVKYLLKPVLNYET